MAITVVVVDLLSFGLGWRSFRYVNIAPVLLFPHQLGFFYADGSFVGRTRLHAAMVLVGLVGLVLLTNPWVFEPFGAARFEWFPGIGHYPKRACSVPTSSASRTPIRRPCASCSAGSGRSAR